jgi:hypothetical protein
MQKSLVIVSQYYMKNIFFEYLTNLKNLLISEEVTINLETVYNQLSELECDIDTTLPNNFCEVLPFEYISRIVNIWELMILETPLLVTSDSPTLCSEAILLLTSIIHPLKYIGDIRPYFTIYDNDFKDYREEEGLKFNNSAIIGVINPICLKILSGWTILHMDTFSDKKNEIANCKRKFAVQPNQALIKVLDSKLPNETFNMYLRMYLTELNNDFLRTFEEFFFTYDIEYMKRLSFVKSKFSVFEIFNKEKFLKFLNTNELYFNRKYIKDKKKVIDLYTHFIDTKIFNTYLNSLL